SQRPEKVEAASGVGKGAVREPGFSFRACLKTPESRGENGNEKHIGHVPPLRTRPSVLSRGLPHFSSRLSTQGLTPHGVGYLDRTMLSSLFTKVVHLR